MTINMNNLVNSYIYPIIYPDNIIVINKTIDKDLFYQVFDNVLIVVYKLVDFVYELRAMSASINWDVAFIGLSICIISSILYERIKDKHGEQLNQQMNQIRYLTCELHITNCKQEHTHIIASNALKELDILLAENKANNELIKKHFKKIDKALKI